MTSHVAEGEPTKDFFIRIITKDITLQDCILDLIDNSIDGALRTSQELDKLEAYYVSVTFHKSAFAIADNCGGISVNEAKHYAFHFGRNQRVTLPPPDAPPPPSSDFIGVYGIGMKRACFKIGRLITIASSTKKESLILHINVPEWQKQKVWDFPFEASGPTATPGTTITIKELNELVPDEFSDPVFTNRLGKIIARDYSRFLQRGLSILVNDAKVSPYLFNLRQSGDFVPLNSMHTDEETGVAYQITAGMSAPPAEDSQDRVEAEYWGWFVLCNERVVLAGDKTHRTVWGDEGFPGWHPQYNGFLGIVSFTSTDPTKLPWTTTKRDIDEGSPLYRRAVTLMKEVSRKWIDYTNLRKDYLEEAKELERKTETVPVSSIKSQLTFTFPRMRTTKVDRVSIQFTKPKRDVQKAAKALGYPGLSASQVGSQIFDWYLENEVQ